MKTVLIVDDDKVSLMTARNVLNDFYKIIAVTEGKQALKFLEKSECDLILLDINMPEMDGFEVNREIKKQYRDKGYPVIFLTSSNDAETETKCFEEGALDFISKPFVPSVILSRVHRIIETEELKKQLSERLDRKIKEYNEIKITSSRDVLTGLWTRKYAEAEIGTFIENGGEKGALLMMDLDNFKIINDVYGHQAGDDVLRIFANTIADEFNTNSICSRLGGDEFMVFIKDETDRKTLSEGAIRVIETTEKRIRELGYESNTSVSVGVSLYPSDAKDYASLYSNSDKALYYVKNNGKSSYRFYGDKKLSDEAAAKGIINLKMFDELVSRTDVVSGAYPLDYDSFSKFYNFFRRLADRVEGKIHTVLFTMFTPNDADESSEQYKRDLEKAMHILEETVHKAVRRADVYTKYSGKQLIVILVDAKSQNVLSVASRINDRYNEINTDDRFKFTFEVSEIRSRGRE